MKNNYKFNGLQHAYLALHYNEIRNTGAWKQLSSDERKRVCSYRAMAKNPDKYPEYKMLRLTEADFARRIDTMALMQYFNEPNIERRYVYVLELNGQEVRSKPVSWNELKIIVDAHYLMHVETFRIEIVLQSNCDDSANLFNE